MITNRILLILVFAIVFLPAIASAQSFWLHNQIFGAGTIGVEGQFAAIDSNDCIMAYQPDFEISTQDYWKSWGYVIADSPSDKMRENTTFGGFVHPSHDLLITGYTDYFGPVGHIVRSTDGGSTWIDSAIGIPKKSGGPINEVRAMAALDSNHIVVLIDSGGSNFCDHALISSDKGVSWRSVPTPPFGYQSDFPPNPIVAYQAPNTLLVTAMQQYAQSTIYRSTDLGETWDSGFVAGKLTTKFAFINSIVGFASGILYDLNAKTETATIDKTTDGGANWMNIFSKQIIPFSTTSFNSTAGLYSLAFADSLHGFACGDQGLILQTTDGGVTWNQLHSDYTVDAQGIDLLSDVAYPDTNHAMICSGDGSVLVYHPNGILSLPNITYPLFSPPDAPQTFDVTWDSVPGATRYSLTITGSVVTVNDTVVVRDTNITSTFYHLSNLLDTSPTQGGVQYEISLQAFNATNESNVAVRDFIVYEGTNGVSIIPNVPGISVEVYPNPAHDILNVEGFSGNVTVSDVLGRSYLCPWQDKKLNVSGLPAGIYYLIDGSTRARFVKE